MPAYFCQRRALAATGDVSAIPRAFFGATSLIGVDDPDNFLIRTDERYGDIGNRETGRVTGHRMVDDVLHPSKSGVALERNVVLAVPVVGKLLGTPVRVVEWRIGTGVCSALESRCRLSRTWLAACRSWSAICPWPGHTTNTGRFCFSVTMRIVTTRSMLFKITAPTSNRSCQVAFGR